MKHRILAFVLCLAAASAELGAQTLGVSPVFFKTYAGSGTPSDPCSATQYNGVIEINGSLAAYQCSKAGGSFAWNGLGAPGGSVTSVSNSDGTLAISPTTGAVVASLNLGNANIWTANQTGPAWIANGSTAGYLALAQGSTNAGSIPSNSILFQAPASVTSFAVTMPGAAASGWLTWTASGGNVTESLTPALSLTTTGTSGAATLNTSTNVLNIPQYSGGGGSTYAFPFTTFQQDQATFGNATSFTITYDHALQASGATIFVIFAVGEPLSSTPSGWTRDVDTGQSNDNVYVLHKTSDSSTSVTLSVTSTASATAYWVEFSGSRSVGASATTATAIVTNNVTFPALTATANSVVFVADEFAAGTTANLAPLPAEQFGFRALGLSNTQTSNARSLGVYESTYAFPSGAATLPVMTWPPSAGTGGTPRASFCIQ